MISTSYVKYTYMEYWVLNANHGRGGISVVIENINLFILWIQKTTGLPVDECLWRRYDG